MDSMVTPDESVGEFSAEVSKVAVSPGLTGAFVGVQFTPVFQLVPGSISQMASTASAGVGLAVNTSATIDAPMTVTRTSATTNSPIEVARKRQNLLTSPIVIFFAIMVIGLWDLWGFRKAFTRAPASSSWTKTV